MILQSLRKVFIICFCAIIAFSYTHLHVTAEEYHFIDDIYLYTQFYQLGFKDPEREVSYNIAATDTITGNIDQDGSLNITLNNLKATTDGNDKFYIGASAGSGYGQQIRGTIGNTSEKIKCTPSTTSSSQNPTYTCSIVLNSGDHGLEQTINFNAIGLSGYYDNNSTTTFSGSLGTNGSLKFDVDEIGNISGTISSYMISAFDYLEFDNYGSKLQFYISPVFNQNNYLESDTTLYIVANIQGTFNNSTMVALSNDHPATIFKWHWLGNNNNLNFTFKSIDDGKLASTKDLNNRYINSICVWSFKKGSVDNTQEIYINPNFNFPSDFKITPLYVGYGLYMPGDIRTKTGMGSREFELTQIGNGISNESQNNASSANSGLSDQMESIDNLESSFNDNLTSGFSNIDLSNNITTDSNFINSALWVSQQFTRIASYPAVNLTLVFCLIVGLAMTIIGKLRG